MTVVLGSGSGPIRRDVDVAAGKIYFAAAAITESLLFVAYLLGRVQLETLLIAHAFVSIFAVLFLVREIRMRGRFGRMAVVVLATALGGPVGAIGSALVIALSKPLGNADKIRELWFKVLSGEMPNKAGEDLYRLIRDDRVLETLHRSPQNFDDILDSGTLRQKQAVLAVLAAQYSPELRPLLEQALKSETPAIRVQSAALITKLRISAVRRLRELLSGDPTSAADRNARLASALDLLDLLRGGLLDASQSMQAQNTTRRILEELIEDVSEEESLRLQCCQTLLERRLFTHAATLLKSLPKHEDAQVALAS